MTRLRDERGRFISAEKAKEISVKKRDSKGRFVAIAKAKKNPIPEHTVSFPLKDSEGRILMHNDLVINAFTGIICRVEYRGREGRLKPVFPDESEAFLPTNTQMREYMDHFDNEEDDYVDDEDYEWYM